MPHLEPAVALATAEQALRELLRTTVGERLGPGWLERVKPDRVSDWQRRIAEERAARKGTAAVSEDLLDYAQLFDLLNILGRYWNDVHPALGDKRVMVPLLERLDDVRNAVAHSRALLPFEEDLIAGIAGEVRNRVTIYMSTRDPAGDPYARVESITDSFGNTMEGRKTTTSYNPIVLTGLTLHPGDVVTYTCRGTDPLGRTLRWQLVAGRRGVTEAEATGGDVTMQWVVTSEHVAQSVNAQIRMTAESEFHRWTEGIDGLALFEYRVDPPR